MRPDPKLLVRYATGDVLLAKQAGELPLAAAVALPLLGYAIMRSSANGMERRREAAAGEGAKERAIEALRESGNVRALKNSGPFLPVSAEVPGYGDDSVDLWGAGKLAEEAGRQLAKQAGIGSSIISGISAAAKPLVSRLPGIGAKASLGSQALTGALGIGGAVAAVKGGKALIGKMDAPARTMEQGFGPALPSYVNNWGVGVH